MSCWWDCLDVNFDVDKDISIDFTSDLNFDVYTDVNYDLLMDVDVCIDIKGNSALLTFDAEAFGENTVVEVQVFTLTNDEASMATGSLYSATA